MKRSKKMANNGFVEQATLLLQKIKDKGKKKVAFELLEAFKNGAITKNELRGGLSWQWPLNTKVLEELFA